MKWDEAWDKIFNEDENVPVNMKNFFREKDIYELENSGLEILLKKLLKSNLKYNLESYILAVSVEIQRRQNKKEQCWNRFLALLAIMTFPPF